MALELNTLPWARHPYSDDAREVLCPRCGYWLHVSIEDGGSGDACATMLTNKHLQVCVGNIAQTLEIVGTWFQDYIEQTKPRAV